jgi:ATP-dependent helicase HrpA
MGKDDDKQNRGYKKFEKKEQGRIYPSDLLTFLAVWKKVFQIEDETARKQFCDNNYLNFQSLEEAKLIYLQLLETLIDFGGQDFKMYLEVKDSMLKIENLQKVLTGKKVEGILKSVASGMIQNICYRNRYGNYSSQKADRISIHPSSLFFNRQPQFIIATEIIETTKLFARNVTEINPDWLKEIAPNFHFGKKNSSSGDGRRSFESNPRRSSYFTKHNRRGGHKKWRR